MLFNCPSCKINCNPVFINIVANSPKDLVIYTILCEKCSYLWNDVEEPSIIYDGIPFNINRTVEDDSYCMDNFLHRCLQCNSISYKVSNTIYKCSNFSCEFEWEVC